MARLARLVAAIQSRLALPGPAHRVRQVLSAFGQLDPPPVDEARWLRRAELRLFREQSAVDQRHARRVAWILLRQGHADDLLLRAALLHDIGKAGARIRLRHRIAWVLAGRLPPAARLGLARRGGPWAALAQHAAIGAARLRAAGADPRLVALVEGRPLAGDATRAELLAQADDAV